MTEEVEQGAEAIYLEDDDDIATVRQRLEQTQARRVLLVVPKGCKALARAVDLRLLRRHADALAMEVALVARNRTTQVLAKEAGFAVFSRMPRGYLSPSAGRRVVSTRKWLMNAFAFVLLSGLLLSIIAATLLIVPEAVVTLVPTAEPIGHVVELQANPNIEAINYQGGEIPARVVGMQIEARSQIQTVAKKDVSDARATGTVIFVNKRNEPTVIPQGTIVRTSAGSNVRFRTIEEAVLPGTIGAKDEVGIVAVDPGLSGNVDAWQINTIEGVTSLWAEVINDTPTRGGTIKLVSVVTNEDKNRLRASLLQRLQQEGYNRLKEQLEEGEFVPPESVVIEPVSETFDKGVDEQADALGLEMQVTASGTAIKLEDAHALAQYLLGFEVKEGFQLLSQGLEFQLEKVTRVEGRKVYFEMSASGLMAKRIDEGGIKKEILGKPIAAAEEYLRQSLQLDEEPSIVVTPDWFGRIPLRIRIIVAPRGIEVRQVGASMEERCAYWVWTLAKNV